MAYFKFQAAYIIEANSAEEAKVKLANDSWNFAADATCERLPDVERQASVEQVLYQLVVEDAQLVAEKELGRSLTDEELRIVEHEIGDYIDWDEAMAFCIRQKIAGEL